MFDRFTFGTNVTRPVCTLQVYKVCAAHSSGFASIIFTDGCPGGSYDLPPSYFLRDLAARSDHDTKEGLLNSAVLSLSSVSRNLSAAFHSHSTSYLPCSFCRSLSTY